MVFEIPTVYLSDDNASILHKTKTTLDNVNAFAVMASKKVKDVDAIARRNDKGEMPVLMDALLTMKQLSDAAQQNMMAMQTTKPTNVSLAEWDHAKQSQWEIVKLATETMVCAQRAANRSEDCVRLAKKLLIEKGEVFGAGAGTVLVSGSVGYLVGMATEYSAVCVGGPAALAAVAAIGAMRILPGPSTYSYFGEAPTIPRNAVSKAQFSAWKPVQSLNCLPAFAVLYKDFLTLNVYYVLFTDEHAAQDYIQNQFSAVGNTRVLCSYDPLERQVYCELEVHGLNRMAHNIIIAAYNKETFPLDHELGDILRNIRSNRAPKGYLEWRGA